MAGWGSFGAAFALFMLAHVVPARPAVRTRLTSVLGESGFLAVYSAVSMALLAWLIAASGRAPYVELWAFAPWQMWVPVVLMVPACLLVAFGVAAPNPLSFGGRAKAGFDPDHPGITGVARHPLLWALALWAGGHVVPNGDLAHVLLFGVFAAFSLTGMRAIDARRRRQMGDVAWRRLAARTSGVPGAAWLDGRWRPGLRIDPVRLGAAAALYAGLVVLHPWVIGVSPVPWPWQSG